MVFILSTGRSGTTTVARWLSAVAGITCLHEPEPALIREAAAFRYGELAGADVERVLRESRPMTAPIYAESSQTLALLVPLLVNLWPEARFVWLLRNGRDMVASAMQKQWYSGHSETHDRYEEATATQQAWIDGRLRADKLGEMTLAEWQTLARFAKCCWYWSAVNRIIQLDLTTADRQPFVLRLETLPTQAPDLLHWLGLDAPVPPIPQTNLAKRPPYHWSQWTAAERAIFDQYCGVEMDRSYPAWRDGLGRWQAIAADSAPRRSRTGMWLNRGRRWWRNLR